MAYDLIFDEQTKIDWSRGGSTLAPGADNVAIKGDGHIASPRPLSWLLGYIATTAAGALVAGTIGVKL